MASLVRTISDRLIEAGDEIAQRLDEGYALIFGGEGGSSSPSGMDENIRGEESVLNDEGFAMEEEEMTHPLEGITEGVLKDAMSKHIHPEGFWENIQAFRAAITWSEPFILCLIGFHIVMFLTVIFVMKRGGLAAGMTVMMMIAGMVYSAESLNMYGAEHWSTFATQNYFDRGGVFIGVMLCAPLFLMALGMLISYVREANRLLVEVKKMEMKAKGKAAAKAKKTNKQD